MNIIVNDLPITGPYRVYDVTTGHFIHSWLDRNAPGDIAPDIAILPVVGLRSFDGVLYIDVRT